MGIDAVVCVFCNGVGIYIAPARCKVAGNIGLTGFIYFFKLLFKSKVIDLARVFVLVPCSYYRAEPVFLRLFIILFLLSAAFRKFAAYN